VAFGQWNNNKVISFISTLGLFGMTMKQHRIGVSKVDFHSPESLKHYAADNFIRSVYSMDKDKTLEDHLLLM